ncbi:hypothetical protein [Micromonospora carbonacea]|uniref:Uncharacterized protein n=1 Tax=Micromonospora carbonacea TaxID=47853 RepID=A0A1C5A2V3_9ACTN|nr:hypothetical protein [Micromonospora carbonacea]SCF39557.1 hypothetical protein GA0070563_11136 [Micromonospora carbonacea]
MAVFPLLLRVQIAPGADVAADPDEWVWQDITQWVRAGGIRITRGRTDEGATTGPSSCALVLKSPDGRWLPLNPLAPEYPGWRRGCPLRVQVSHAGTWWTRFTGIVGELEPGLASDRAHDTYEVDVLAFGVLQRLGRGSAVRSPLLRLMTGTQWQAYAPLEDGPGTTGPTVYATKPTAGRATGGVTFGARDEGLPGSSSVARLESTSARITVPAAGGVFVVSDTVIATAQVYMTSPQLDAEADLTTLTLSGPVVDRIVVRASKALIRATAYLEETQVGTTSMSWPLGVDPTAGWVGVQVSLTRPGLVPNTQISVRVHPVGSLVWTTSSAGSITGSSVGYITGITLLAAGVQGTSFSHLGVVLSGALPEDTAWAASGYAGEDAGARLERVAADESVPLLPVGVAGTLMGPQPLASLLDIARDVEATDGGILYESLDGRMAYLPRVARYNRPADLPLTYSQLAPGLAPTDDDLDTSNDWTVSRPGGGSERVADEEHVAQYGRYEQSATVNVASDDDTRAQAGWRVHLGTVSDLRYPQIALNFGREAAAAALPAWLAADRIGARTTVSRVAAGLAVGGIDQHIEGYTEVLDRYMWDVRLVCAPAGPWRVWVIGDQVLGRLDTGGSGLAVAAGESDASLVVVTDPGLRRWITSAERPGDFPFHVQMGGEVVQVTDISGTSGTQTWSVVRAVNGVSKSHPAGTRVGLAYVEAQP